VRSRTETPGAGRYHILTPSTSAAYPVEPIREPTVREPAVRAPAAAPPSLPAQVKGLAAKAQALLSDFMSLAVLELKTAGIGLAIMVGLGLAAAVLLITGWLGLVAFALALLVEADIFGWITALLIAAVLSLAGAAACVFFILKRSEVLMFKASRRQLGLGAGENHE
jgi:uncharacterized membrane protein YqjE